MRAPYKRQEFNHWLTVSQSYQLFSWAWAWVWHSFVLHALQESQNLLGISFLLVYFSSWLLSFLHYQRYVKQLKSRTFGHLHDELHTELRHLLPNKELTGRWYSLVFRESVPKYAHNFYNLMQEDLLFMTHAKASCDSVILYRKININTVMWGWEGKCCKFPWSWSELLQLETKYLWDEPLQGTCYSFWV